MNFIDYLQTKYTYSPRTLQDKQVQIENWKNLCLKNQTLKSLTTKELVKLIEKQKQRYKVQSLNNQLRTLEQYYHYQIEEKNIEEHPLKNFRIKTEIKPIIKGLLTEQELRTLYEDYSLEGQRKGQKEPYRQRNKVILGLIIYQALDNTTLSKIEIQDIDLQNRIIKVPKISTYKLRERILTLEKNQIRDLQTYLEETRELLLRKSKQERETEKLFPKSENTKFSSITQSIKRQIKVDNLLILRYSRISFWIKQSNLIQAQYNSGYKNIISLEKLDLTHLEKLQQDIEKYHPL